MNGKETACLLALASGLTARADEPEPFLEAPAYLVTQADCAGTPQAPRMSGSELLFECLDKSRTSLWHMGFFRRPEPVRADGKAVTGENPVWHPDGRHIAFQDERGMLHLALLEDGKITKDNLIGPGRRPQFSKPLGHVLFYETVDRTPQLRYRFLEKDPMHAKKAIGLLRGPIAKMTSHAFSHPNWGWDGSSIFFVAGAPELKLSSKQEDNKGERSGEGIQLLISELRLASGDVRRMVELRRRMAGMDLPKAVAAELGRMSPIPKSVDAPLTAASFMAKSEFSAVYYAPLACGQANSLQSETDGDGSAELEDARRRCDEERQTLEKTKADVAEYERRSPEALSKELIGKLGRFRKEATIVPGFTRRDFLVGWVYGIFELTEREVENIFLPRLWKTSIFGAPLARVANDDVPLPQKWPAPDRSGEYVAFEAGHFTARHLYIAKLATGQAVRLTGAGSYNSSPEIAPDGQTLLFESNRGGQRGIVSAKLNWSKIQAALAAPPP